MESTNKRPLILEMDETKQELIDCVNNALNTRGIPFYLLESILTEIMVQVRDGSRAELEQAKRLVAEEGEKGE